MRTRSNNQKSLLQSQNSFNVLFESTSDGMLFVNLNGIIEVVNGKIEKMFGYNREELVGTEIELLVPGIENDSHRKKREEYTSQEVMSVREMSDSSRLRGLCGGGKEIDIEVSLVPMKIEGKKLILAIVRDVSDRLRLEAQLRQSQKMDALGQLAGGIAHDLNNVLTAIQGYTELDLLDHDKTNSNLTEILGATERAARLVDQLLSFTRQQTLHAQILDLNDIVSDMIKMLRPLISANISLSQEVDHALPNIRADSNQIEQVLMNLIVNARDAVEEGGEICIKTHSAELDEIPGLPSVSVERAVYTIFSIRDTGKGIDLEKLDKVFDPFYTTKGKGSGTGLGLSVVYGIVKQSGGYITVDSAPEEGATFTLYLPSTSEVAEAIEVSGDSYLGADFTCGPILIVEDEPDIRKLNRMFLKGLECEIVDVSCAGRALELIEESPNRFALIISDVRLPGMDGAELAARLLHLSSSVKILLVSGNPVNNKQELLGNERVSYLAKPYRLQQFLDKIFELMSQKGNDPILVNVSK